MSRFVQSAALANHWYPVAESIDVESGALAVRLLGTDYVMWRGGDGEIVAAIDRCPHREAPLSIGDVREGVLTCPYHGWAFADGGRCIAIPSSGDDVPIAGAANLRCCPIEERYGLVWLCPGEPVGSLPSMPWDDDPRFRRINTGIEPWATSATRMVDNFMDISHFPWVHSGTFGRGQEPRVPKIELGPLDDGFYGYAYEVDAVNPEEAVATSGSTDDVVHRHMSTGFHLPFTVRSTIRYGELGDDDALQHILLLCSTPVDDEHALFTFVVWRNDDFGIDPEEIIGFDRAIGTEDKAMLERIPGTLPLGRLDLVNVQADKPSVEWRRQFSDLIGLDR